MPSQPGLSGIDGSNGVSLRDVLYIEISLRSVLRFKTRTSPLPVPSRRRAVPDAPNVVSRLRVAKRLPSETQTKGDRRHDRRELSESRVHRTASAGDVVAVVEARRRDSDPALPRPVHGRPRRIDP